MKRLFVLICAFFLLSVSVLALEVSPAPNGINLTWEAAKGAAYYDVYIDSNFIARLTSQCLSYTVKGLLADHEYQVAVRHVIRIIMTLHHGFQRLFPAAGTANTYGSIPQRMITGAS